MPRFVKTAGMMVALTMIIVITASLTFQYVVPAISSLDIAGYADSFGDKFYFDETRDSFSRTGKAVSNGVGSGIDTASKAVGEGVDSASKAVGAGVDSASKAVGSVIESKPVPEEKAVKVEAKSDFKKDEVKSRLAVSKNSHQTDVKYLDTSYRGSAQPPYATGESGMVTRIVDGDTLDVDNIRIRLALVNTPEVDEAGYLEATAYIRYNCPPTTTVVYDPDSGQKEGSHDRVIAEVWCFGPGGHSQGASINQMLLEAGHAEILVKHCKASEFGKSAWARQHGC